MESRPTRRNLLAAATCAVGVAVHTHAQEAPLPTPAEPFGYCLNTSTIRGQNLPLLHEIEIAAKVGFGAVEPWINEIDKHISSGQTLADLRKAIEDHGLKVPSAIGFAEWIVDDDARRAKGLEQMKRDMDHVAQIGGTRIAAPPVGLGKEPEPVPGIAKIAERYRAILDLGKQMGVTPELELWGFARVLHRLSEVTAVAIEAGDGACLLLDVYHLYKGGSDFAGLKLLNGKSLGVVHTNDYPNIPRDKINDSNRVYPGDGVAPLTEILKSLKQIGWAGYLSVELFNKDYWRESPEKVARTALEKIKACVANSRTR